jgi:hypothetical protein
VKQIWQNEPWGTSPLQKWQFKIQKLRQFLRGWAKTLVGHKERKRGDNQESW